MKRNFNVLIILTIIGAFVTACDNSIQNGSDNSNITFPQSTQTSTASALIELDPAYYDGIVVITQFYTYLDQGLYQNAYDQFHPSRPNPQSYPDFLLGAEKAYRTVEIVTIQPYAYWAAQHGYGQTTDPEGQYRFYVEIRVTGDEGWWADEKANFVITLSADDAKLKIVSIDTIPVK